MKSFLLMLCLFAAIAANAKEKPIQLFPRTYGYFSRGDSETRTITYDHAYGQYGWKNAKNVDLSVYNHIVLEIEATDSRVEIHVLYEGAGKSTCIGRIDAGKTKAVCKLEHIDKVRAIYIAKSKVGIIKIVKFVLTDEID